MYRWAQTEGFELAVIYREPEEGSIAVLTELIRQLQLTGDQAVVVPSLAHFGTSRVLQEHLAAFLIHCADASLYEASGR